MRHLRIACVLGFFALTSPLAAQRMEPHTIARGERARVIVPRSWRSSEIAIGVVDFVSRDSITLHLDREPGRFSTRPVRGMRIDVSRGRGDARRGAAFGALTGLFAGVVVGYAAGEDCGPGSFVCYDRSETVPVAALGGMLAGAAIGAMVNAGERWKQAVLPR